MDECKCVRVHLEWSKDRKSAINGLVSLYINVYTRHYQIDEAIEIIHVQEVFQRDSGFFHRQKKKCLICVLKSVNTELVIQKVSVNVRNPLKKFPGDV